MEQACKVNITVKALAENSEPDHDTIAAFISTNNAAKEWSGTTAGLRKKKEKLEKHISRLLLKHKELDKSEEAEKIQKPYQKTMGDAKENGGGGA